jgi:acetyltransferase-like isoleucine patch superfamily enzyme
MLKRRLAYALLRIVQAGRIAVFAALSTCRAQGRPRLHQPLQLAGSGTIRFGRGIAIGVFPSPYYLSSYAYVEARGTNASVEIGDHTAINNGFVAIAEHTAIRIGAHVLIGTNVEIYDSDFHGLQADRRQVSDPADARPVCIGDHVFLGSNVKILKGVQIGAGSVVANGAVVIGDIPPNVVAGGIPARVIRSLA